MNPANATTNIPGRCLYVGAEGAQSYEKATTSQIPKFEPTKPQPVRKRGFCKAFPDELSSADPQKESTVSNWTGYNIEGKHIAKRKVDQWLDYGDPKIWDSEFESAAIDAADRIKNGTLTLPFIIEHFEKIRFTIASKRNNPKAHLFGSRRNINSHSFAFKSCYTSIKRQDRSYGYALERAVKIPYDGKHYIESKSDDGKYWTARLFYGRGARGPLRYGLVQGYIDDKSIPLTQYVFCPRTPEHRRCESEEWFGVADENYIGDNNESGLWLHTGVEQIPVVLKHIDELLAKAIAGDLTVIPRIHWWYVHLAPNWRGPGGIAEMMTNTLCRLHNIDLPPWKEGIAPSVEVLLEPDEEKFCSNYHQLFESDQEKLKILFKATD